MDPKYTPIEEANRTYWKKQAAEAQESLLRIKSTAAEREKREREVQAGKDRLKREADAKAAQDKVEAVKAGDQIKAFIDDVEKVQHLYGVKVTSWETKTNAINNQVTVYMQITKIGEPRAVSPRLWY